MRGGAPGRYRTKKTHQALGQFFDTDKPKQNPFDAAGAAALRPGELAAADAGDFDKKHGTLNGQRQAAWPVR